MHYCKAVVIRAQLCIELSTNNSFVFQYYTNFYNQYLSKFEYYSNKYFS